MKLGFAIPHEIRIRASANMGFIVKVGCGEFVSPGTRALLHDLEEYIEDPKGWEEDYNKLPGRGRDEAERIPPPRPTRGTLVEARGSDTEGEDSSG